MKHFFIVGAAKAATTSMQHYLDQHPQIAMCGMRWTRYFHFNGPKPDLEGFASTAGSAFLRESQRRYNAMRNTAFKGDVQAYLALWESDENTLQAGESSPTYLYDRAVPSRINEQFNDARIVIILRNPVDRAFSHFKMDVRRKWIPPTSFQEALSLEPAFIDNFWWGTRHYLRQGLYFSHLRRYLDVFGEDRVKILRYEDLKAGPHAFMDTITNFLSVEQYSFDLSKTHNQSESEWEQNADANFEGNRRLRLRLLDFYHADIIRTAKITGLDLSDWLTLR